MKRRELSADMVMILSDPHVLRALEVFQGVCEGSESETEVLKDQRVLRALKSLQSNVVGEESILASSTPILGVTPPSSEIQNIIPPEHIKRECSGSTCGRDRGAKRKLVDLASFADAVKNTPKAKKKKGQTQHPVVFSAGSLIRGVIVSRDASMEDLLKFADGKVEIMKKLDGLLKKTPVSSQKITRKLFETVSFIFTLFAKFPSFIFLFPFSCS